MRESPQARFGTAKPTAQTNDESTRQRIAELMTKSDECLDMSTNKAVNMTPPERSAYRRDAEAYREQAVAWSAILRNLAVADQNN